MGTSMMEAAVKLTVMPQYLPVGAEDCTTLKVGVVDGTSIIKMGIWRSETSVCFKYNENVVKTAIVGTDNTEKVDVQIDLNTKIDLSFVVDGFDEYDGEYKVHGEHNGYPFYIQCDNFGAESLPCRKILGTILPCTAKQAWRSLIY